MAMRMMTAMRDDRTEKWGSGIHPNEREENICRPSPLREVVGRGFGVVAHR